MMLADEAPTDVPSETATEVRATYKVTGMTCNHCRASVEKAIRRVPGVTDVDVDLPTGVAYVVGAHDADALLAAVSAIGFEAETM